MPTKDELITDMVLLLNGVAGRDEQILLHQLLWSIDAKHHLIPNPDEINFAIEKAGGFQISRNENEIALRRDESGQPDLITQEDLDEAMKIYHKYIDDLRPGGIMHSEVHPPADHL